MGRKRRRNHCAPAGDVVGHGRGGEQAAGTAPATRPRQAPASAGRRGQQPDRPPVACRARPPPRSGTRAPALAQLGRDQLGRLGLARRTPRRARCAARRSTRSRSSVSVEEGHGGAVGYPAVPDEDCIFCKIVAGELPVRAGRRGRAHDRVHGHQPVDPRPRAGDPARALAQPVRDRPTTTSRHTARAAKRLARADARPPRRRRREPAQLLRAGRLADGLPLPRARDPALRRRPAAPAGRARWSPARTSWPRWPRSCAVSERARYERDGDARRRHDRRPAAEPLRPRADRGGAATRSTRRPRTRPRALVVRAEGKVFTGGADVNVFDGLSEAEAREFTAELLAHHPQRRGPAVPDAGRACTACA